MQYALSLSHSVCVTAQYKHFARTTIQQKYQQKRCRTKPLLNSIFMHFFRLIISFIGSFTISAGGIFFLFRFMHSFDGKIQSESDIYVFASPKCACPSCFSIKAILIERKKRSTKWSERERRKEIKQWRKQKKKRRKTVSNLILGVVRFGYSTVHVSIFIFIV